MKKILLMAAVVPLMATFAWADYKEAPMLAARVAAGELPPVEERLPLEPKVRAVFDEIGTYGGQVIVFGNGPNPWAPLIGENPEGSPTTIRMDYDGSLEPDHGPELQSLRRLPDLHPDPARRSEVVQRRSIHGRGFFVPTQRHAEGGAGLRVGHDPSHGHHRHRRGRRYGGDRVQGAVPQGDERPGDLQGHRLDALRSRAPG